MRAAVTPLFGCSEIAGDKKGNAYELHGQEMQRTPTVVACKGRNKAHGASNRQGRNIWREGKHFGETSKRVRRTRQGFYN